MCTVTEPATLLAALDAFIAFGAFVAFCAFVACTPSAAAPGEAGDGSAATAADDRTRAEGAGSPEADERRQRQAKRNDRFHGQISLLDIGHPPHDCAGHPCEFGLPQKFAGKREKRNAA
jgi:hypothetical protein